MKTSIPVSERSQADIRSILDIIQAGRKASDHLPTYLEALASALDVPHGWLFDYKAMAFEPPVEESVVQEVVEEN